MKIELICSGFGGQGSLTVGKFLASAGMKEGKNVTWLPSYGPEMRGGTANVSAIISEKPIASPLVTNPDILIALNQPSVDKFGPAVKSGGLMVVNTDLAPHKLDRDDIEIIYAPMSTIANEIGSLKVLNMVAVGVVVGKTRLVQYETVVKDLKIFFEKKDPKILEINLDAINRGMAIGQKN
jgi:2-oxoglutarate ferredoxin oxidoreductase subunit gamma